MQESGRTQGIKIRVDDEQRGAYICFCLNITLSYTSCLSIIFVGSLLFRQYKIGSPILSPVSYTHLDVYKRQTL